MLTVQEVETSAESFLIENQGKGLPLVISFGFYDVHNNPRFNFYGRLKKLEVTSGRAINKLLLRDPKQLWYLNGIQGLGDSLMETVSALKALIEKFSPSSVTTIGQSMGGYGAILYGVLLEASKVVSFGPLSSFDPNLWRLIGDQRWLGQTYLLEQNGVDLSCSDLPSLLRKQVGHLPVIDLIYGTNPGENASRADAVGLDTAHAMRFEGFSNVAHLPLYQAPHAVVEYLRANGVITEVLQNRLFGYSLDQTISGLRSLSPLSDWVEKNLALGCSAEQLRTAMTAENRVSNQEALAIIDRAFLAQALTLVNATKPVVTI